MFITWIILVFINLDNISVHNFNNISVCNLDNVTVYNLDNNVFDVK